jgi:hypothetical protein
VAFLQALLKLALAFVIVVAGFLGLGFGLEWYYRTPLQRFCGSIPPSATLEAVYGAAKEEGFFVFDPKLESKSLSILNHRSFIFRYGCEVEFANDKPVSKEFFVAD